MTPTSIPSGLTRFNTFPDSRALALLQVLGLAHRTGSIEAGKLADLVLWKVDTLAHASIADPVIALVLGAAAPVTLSLVGGRTVVEDNHLTTVDEDAITRATRSEARRLAETALRS